MSCPQCGKEIPAGIGGAWASKRQRRYCSMRCSQIAYRRREGYRPLEDVRQERLAQRVSVVCPTCGKALMLSPGRAATFHFCSRACKRGTRVGRHNGHTVAEYYPFRSKREWDAARRRCAKAFNVAVRDGVLVPQPCEVCGDLAEGHHEDYGKPLEVRWLCRHHHRQRHAELKKQGHSVMASAVPTNHRPLRHRRSSHLLDSSAVALVKQVTAALSQVRCDSGVTEMALADRLRVSRQLVNRQFAGGFRTLATVAAYAEALGCELRVQVIKRDTTQQQAAA